MTGKRPRNDPARVSANSANKASIDDAATDGGAAGLDAAGAKASVHEAIGKLIGDDDERRRGTAEKKASGIAPSKSRDPSGP